MNIAGMFKPKPTLSEQDVARGLRFMTWESVASTGFGSITTSGILTAFALVLGANNLEIGVLAALPFLSQPLQIPAILLVERIRRRKLIAVNTWGLAQALWVPTALIPIMVDVPSAAAVSMLLGLSALRGMLTALTNAAWNGWVRDLVPQQILGRFFSRRLALATTAAAGFGLAAAFFIDGWKVLAAPGNEVFGYTAALLFGALFIGMWGPIFMSFMPEPLMQTQIGRIPSLRETLAAPFSDKNFRQLLKFLFVSQLALNLAVPFFAVYMLRELGLPLYGVILLTALGQLSNVLALRVWGPLVDKYSSKVILSICTSLYVVLILGWAFTTMPERYFLTIPLLVVLHLFAGIASAGVSLSTATIGLKLAPQGQATAYLAVAALAVSLGAGLGPLLGGPSADFLASRELSLAFSWQGPAGLVHFPGLFLTGFDFLFALAFIIGLLSINLLVALREQGEVGKEVVLDELLAQARQVTRPVSSVPGLRFLSFFPYGYLRRVPSLGVAVGITVYQVAFSIKTAVSAAGKGERAASDVVRRISQAVDELPGDAVHLREHTVEVIRHATRGAMHAVDELALDLGNMAREAVHGAVIALGSAGGDPWEAFWGAGYGTTQGAEEIGAEVGQAAAQAVQGAQEAARELGLSQKEAAARTADGAMKAAEAIGPEAVSAVSEALSRLAAEAGRGGDGATPES